MMSWVHLSVWSGYLLSGLLLCITMIFFSIVIGKAGRNPYWALLSLVPFLIPVIVWVLAIVPWTKPVSKSAKNNLYFFGAM